MTTRVRNAPDTLSGVDIRISALGGPPLVRDYLAGTGPAAAFYQGAPGDVRAFRAKLEEVQRRFDRPARERAARTLRPTSQRARERLADFVERGGAVVTTGQQTGFLTGPLYTIAKALTLVRLADALEAQLEVPVLPVFWAASEDHDWAEVNHAYLSSADGVLRRVELGDRRDLPIPMSERVLDEGVESALDEAAQVLAESQHAPDVLNWIRGAYRPGQTVAGAFSALLEEMLAPFDVLLTDAADPHLKQASAPVLVQALREAPRLEARVADRSRALQQAGYHQQVTAPEGSTNLFHRGDAGRERLDRSRGGIVARSWPAERPLEEVAREVEAHPERFSPNVLLRPVVESAVFPTLAYVAGPGEISYFAQLGVLFEEFGMLPPVVVPRASLTLVEAPVAQLAEELQLSPGDLARPEHEVATELARRAVPAEVSAALDRLSRELAEGYARLIDAASPLESTLTGALGRLRNESLLRVAESERRVTRAVKRREAETMQRLERLRAALQPEGAPQERVLNVIPFLARHGPALLQEIAARIPIALGADR